jgi:hypothetical protein
MADVLAELAKLKKEEEAIAAKRDKLMASVEAEYKAKIEAIIDEANSTLGKSWALVEGDRLAGSRKPKSAGTSNRGVMAADKECPICKFRTNPPHDARKHRTQGDNKKPFTAEELTAMGMTKVG